MRDPKRIDRIMELLHKAWTNHPDQRLGQIIINAQRWNDQHGNARDPFNVEDDTTEAGLYSMIELKGSK